MNKISNLALEISQDIYAISSEVDTANHDMHNFKITPSDYSNKLYITACKALYMKQVIEVVKTRGYKFRNYEKEMELLNSIVDIVEEDLNISNVTSLTNDDVQSLDDLTKKYSKIVPVDDIEDDLEI